MSKSKMSVHDSPAACVALHLGAEAAVREALLNLVEQARRTRRMKWP